MRVNYLLLLAAAVIFTSAHAASETTNTEQTKMISSDATSRFLRKHEASAANKQNEEEEDDEEEEEEEERALNLETIVNWFKSFGTEKMDDLAPKLTSEMNKLDDVVDAKKLDDVVNAKKLDDATDFKKLAGAKTEASSEEMAKAFVKTFDDWKMKKFSLERAAQEMRNGGVKDEAAIQQVMKWYYIFAVYVK